MRSFARDQVPLSEGMILALHRQVLYSSNPEHAGRYREVAVRVGNDTTPYPAKAKAMMKDAGCRPMAQNFAKVEQEHHFLVAGARLHLDTVVIHPFFDGNGRTSRFLLDYVLLKHNHPLFVHKVEDKPAYFQAIRDSKQAKSYELFTHYVIGQASRSLKAKINLLEKPHLSEPQVPKAQKKKDANFDVFQWHSEVTEF